MLEDMDNAKKIIDKIKLENIHPTPALKFKFTEYSRWVAYLIFITLGSLSFSIILFAISVNGFDLMDHFAHSRFESLLVLLPLIWLVTLLIFLAGAIYSITKTNRSYKFTFGKWIGISVGISMIAGTMFFLTGGARWLENKFETNIESYESLLEKKTAIWSQPNLGTLSGIIMAVSSDTLSLKDWKNKIWTIEMNEAFVAPIIELEAGSQIKINGQMKGDSTFKAEKIRPWGGTPGKCAQ
jgi:hypothetical protein